MASSSSDTATLQAQLAEARAEAEKAKKSAMRWKSKHDAVKEATRAAAQAAADLGTEGFVIDEKELLCSVCSSSSSRNPSSTLPCLATGSASTAPSATSASAGRQAIIPAVELSGPEKCNKPLKIA